MTNQTKYEKCPDCYCHYKKGENHICLSWVKILVKRYKEKKKENYENKI